MSDDSTTVGLTITSLTDRPGLTIVGDVDFRSLEAFSAAIAEALEAHPGDVHVDLSGLAFIEVSGMRVLADAARQFSGQGRRLVLEGLAPHLSPVLKLVGWYDSAGLPD